METISIRPQVNILGMLKHLDYHAWYALAEFVDNAIASYFRDKEHILAKNRHHKLVVSIEIDDEEKKIVIRDNAGGIPEKDFARAFRAAEIPPDNSGLSEFGMGMKSAACWFTSRWKVYSSAIGESVCRVVDFSLEDILEAQQEEISVFLKNEKPENHYTVIELLEIPKMPVKRTRGKIRTHLASIYRVFLRAGDLVLKINGEELIYDEPKVLCVESPYNKELGVIPWKMDVEICLSGGAKRVHGFVALRETMSNTETGFALFRRGRVIEGSAEDGFKPKEILGDVGSPEFKRIFGELHFEGFDVSFTKKGIQWDEYLDEFLDEIKVAISSSDFNLLKLAREYRVRPSRHEQFELEKACLDNTSRQLENLLNQNLEGIRENSGTEVVPEDLPIKLQSYHRTFEVVLSDCKWTICMEISSDPSLQEWLEVGSRYIPAVQEKKADRMVGIRMFIDHPFVNKYALSEKGGFEALLLLAAAIGVGEEASREAGVRSAGSIRRNINQVVSFFSDPKVAI